MRRSFWAVRFMAMGLGPIPAHIPAQRNVYAYGSCAGSGTAMGDNRQQAQGRLAYPPTPCRG